MNNHFYFLFFLCIPCAIAIEVFPQSLSELTKEFELLDNADENEAKNIIKNMYILSEAYKHEPLRNVAKHLFLQKIPELTENTFVQRLSRNTAKRSLLNIGKELFKHHLSKLSNDAHHNLVGADSKSDLARDMFVHFLEKNAAKNKANNVAKELFSHHLSKLSNDSPHNLVGTDSKSNLARKNAAKNKANDGARELLERPLSKLSNEIPPNLVGTDSKSNLARDMFVHFLEKNAAKNKANDGARELFKRHVSELSNEIRPNLVGIDSKSYLGQENKNNAPQPIKVNQVFPQHLLKTKSKETRQVA